MPQMTVTDVPQRVPVAIPGSGGIDIELQNAGANPLEFAPRKGLTYGGAAGGLRLTGGTPGMSADRRRIRDHIYVVCASGQTTTLTYETF